MPDVEDELVLVVGSTQPFDVALFDANDAPEDLSDADRATLVVRESISDTGTPVLALSTDTDDGLAIDVTGHRLVGTLTGALADALPPGVYIAAANIRYGTDDDWKTTDPFIVRVRAAIAGKV